MSRHPRPGERETMRQRWSIEEIVASLEKQAAFHRERQGFHAEHETVHQK
jgi:hypothetical protein